MFTLLPMTTDRGQEYHGKILREAAALVEGGNLLPLMDKTVFTLDSALEAHHLVEAGKARGKVVVNVAALA